MVIENFGDTWNNFYNWCVLNSVKLGIPEDSIYMANPLVSFSPVAPFLCIFALPNEEDSNILGDSIGEMRFTLFIAGDGSRELSSAVIDSVMRAGTIRKAILKEYTSVSLNENSKPAPETMYSDSCIISFELSSYYKV